MFNFFLGGILFILAAYVLLKLKQQQKLNAKNIVLLACAFLTFLLGALWAGMSIGEGEVQAGIMGLLIFGVIGSALSFFLYRSALKTQQMSGSSDMGVPGK